MIEQLLKNVTTNLHPKMAHCCEVLKPMLFNYFCTISAAMKLKEVMLMNGILYNSEACHGVTKNHIKNLETIDEDMLRKFPKAHKKTPKEFLYLETGAIPIRWIIAQRRINLFKHILEKDKNLLIRKVYEAQKETPTSGEFVQLVEKDITNLNISHEEITQSTRVDQKKKN